MAQRFRQVGARVAEIDTGEVQSVCDDDIVDEIAALASLLSIRNPSGHYPAETCIHAK